MKIKICIAIGALMFFSASNISAQIEQGEPTLPTSKSTDHSAVKQNQQIVSNISREQRSQAYAKLLEAQHYIWTANRLRQQTASNNNSTQSPIIANIKLAKQTLQKAAELNPNLAEAYTALADLAKYDDINESILMAGIAVKIEPDNFGAHQILAQLYTFKSRLNRNALDLNFARKAIVEWNEVARLDPRNAEAFAFLSELYDKISKKTERIAALKNWLSASAPNSDGFYGNVIYRGESLAPQTAALKLGQALLEDKQTREAVEILSLAVAEEPENSQAINLLASAIKSADKTSVAAAVQALQQAIFATPENPALFLMLAEVQFKMGKTEAAEKILRDASDKFAEKNKNSSADLQVALADIYGDSNRIDEAAAVYQKALTIRGIEKNKAVTEEEREFAVQVFEKIINLYSKANRPNDAKATIERARILLGQKDLFADRRTTAS